MRTPNKLLCALAPGLAAAWWDEGHALSTTVARLQLIEDGDENVVTRIEELLKLWDYEFPELLGNIHYMSIWADHQKCYKDDGRCEGLDRLPGVRVFDPWHWTSVPYSPNDYKPAEKSVYHHYPLKDTGSNRLMTMAIRDITNSATTPLLAKYSTSWSLNIHLRFLAHMYTDFHQPCHALETFAKPWIDDCEEKAGSVCGDLGASRWLIDQNCTGFANMDNKPHNLHNMWDAILVDGGHSWPNIPVAELEIKAKDWMANHKPTTDELELDFKDIDLIQAETHGYAADVFEGFVWKDGQNAKDNPWPTDWTSTEDGDPKIGARCPTAEYLDKMKIVARKRVVLGGIRFAKLLKYMEPFLPPLDSVKPKTAAPTTETQTGGFLRRLWG